MIPAGTRFGSYEITAAIGSGGMGEVYRARDTKLGRDVALKILPDSFTHDPERVARFRREAQVLASLNHPHIGAIYGLDEVNGQQFLVLELVDGESLADRIKRGRLPVDEALAIAKQIAEALEAAHEKGIIHRDLKPANIALTKDGQVKVLDFGLAKAVETTSGSIDLANSPTITSPAMMTGIGVILGTAAYMPPEQAKGRAADKRSDIWAFGCVLYEMLTGRRAFGGEEVSDTLAFVITKDPDWSALGAVPGPVQILLRRCLERDPTRRLAHFADARLELEDALVPTAATREQQSSERRLLSPALVMSAAVVLIASVLGLIAILLRVGSEPTKMPHIVFSVLPPSGMLTTPGTGITPDGRYVGRLLTDPKKGIVSLWLRPLGDAAFHQVSGTEGANGIFWSPDGSHVGFASGGQLKTASIDGGPVSVLADIRVSRGGSWGSRGVIVFSPDEQGPLWSVPAAGGAPQRVTAIETANGETSHRYPTFLPDGNHFVFLVRSLKADASGIYLGSLSGASRHRRIVASDSDASYSLGHLLFVRQGNLVAQRFNTKTFEVDGEPFVVTTDIDYAPNTGRASFGTTTSGVLTYFSARRAVTHLVWFRRNGDAEAEATRDGFYTDFAVSPDGDRIVFTRREHADSNTVELWVQGRERDTETKIVGGLPSVTRILATDGVSAIVGVRERGTTSVRQYDLRGVASVTEVMTINGDTAWGVRRDGRSVVFGRAGDLFAQATGQAERLIVHTSGRQTGATFDPSGDWILYLSNETGRDELYVRDISGQQGRVRVSSAGAIDPSWSPDGHELYFRTTDGSFFAVPALRSGATLQFSAPSRLFSASLPSVFGRTYAVTRDGRVLINVLADEIGARASLVDLNWLDGSKYRNSPR